MILLTTPRIVPGEHGQPSVTYARVAIRSFLLDVFKKRVVITLQYGNLVDGEWSSAAPVFRLKIGNEPAVMTEGVDPDTGGWTSAEVEAANPAFSNMRAGFAIEEDDVGQLGYDVTGAFLYAYLITNGYYEGTIE